MYLDLHHFYFKSKSDFKILVYSCLVCTQFNSDYNMQQYSIKLKI